LHKHDFQRLLFPAYLFIASTLLVSTTYAAREFVPIDEDKAIALKISNRSFNRIGVQGDRIQEIILSNDEVVIERDEAHGFVYLRVPSEHSQKVDVTVVTESGVVQDLTLEPVNQASVAIILKKESTDKGLGEFLNPSQDDSNLTYPLTTQEMLRPIGNPPSFQETLINLMKYLATGWGSTDTSILEERVGPESLSLYPQRYLVQNNLIGLVYEITNTSHEEITLSEKEFYKLGDLSLALSRHRLKRDESAFLYVIRKEV